MADTFDPDAYLSKQSSGFNPDVYLKSKVAAAPTIQEMPDDVSFMDRFKVKNFGADKKAAADFLQKQYPDYQVKLDGDQYLMRKPGDTAWKTLDPQDGFTSLNKKHPIQELAQDATDLLWDVGSGVGTSVATGLGGALGGLVGNVPGAAVGATTAGASAGAGLELLRQKLGNMFGIDQKTNKGDIASAAIGGAVAPLVFGSGATGNQLVNATGAGNVIRNFLGKEALTTADQLAAKEAQRGALGYGYSGLKNKLLPWVGDRVLSGIPEDTIRSGAQYIDKIKDAEKNGLTSSVADSFEKIRGAVNAEQQRSGQAIADKIEGTATKVDIEPAKQEFKNLLDHLKSYKGEIDSPLLREKIASVQKSFDNIFTIAQNEENPLSKLVDASGLPLIKDEGKKEIASQVSARSAFQLQHDLSELAELSKIKGGLMSRFPGSTNVAEKELAETSRGAYDAINKSLDLATSNADDLGGGTGELKAAYKRHMDLKRELAPMFSSPEKTYQTLSNLSGPNKQLILEKLQKMDNALGTNTIEDAKFLNAYKTFSQAPADAISSRGVTSTNRGAFLKNSGRGIGALIGYKMGSDQGHGGSTTGALVGGMLGGGAAMKLGSPAMVRWLIERGANVDNLGKAMGGRVMSAAPMSAWNLLRNRDEKQNQ